MLLYILLIALCVLLTLISLGFVIGGLIKKNQKLWIFSLISFVVCGLLTVVASYTYVKKSIEYMASDEFQDETRKTAESMGKTWGNTVSGAADGLEATLDEESIEKLANKSGKILGKGVKAMATGLDESIGSTTVFLDESIASTGIKLGRAQNIADSGVQKYGLFLEFDNAYKGKLRLTAYDSKGQKQDIADKDVDVKKGHAEVFLFTFKHSQPGVSGYCILSKL